jgi:hypothetical protein
VAAGGAAGFSVFLADELFEYVIHGVCMCGLKFSEHQERLPDYELLKISHSLLAEVVKWADWSGSSVSD